MDKLVPIQTLEVGAEFRTTDWPEANIPGKRGKLLYVNPSRARVVFNTGNPNVDYPIDIGANTMVYEIKPNGL